MVQGLAVLLEHLSGLVMVILHHGQVLADLVARHGVPGSIGAVALELDHPAPPQENKMHVEQGALWGATYR